MKSGYRYYVHNVVALFGSKHFRGWGYKRTGRFAQWCHRMVGGTLTLEEDGFIRSIGLGVEGGKPFSVVRDDHGIYYDANTSSALEIFLNSYDFTADTALCDKADNVMAQMRRYRISKYNLPLRPISYFTSLFANEPDTTASRILVISQTAGDASLVYGRGETFSTEKLISDALEENPDAVVYIKVHPDVVSGKRRADFKIDTLPERCRLIQEIVEPMQLLAYVEKVYTRTSGMGMEALIMGKEVHCYGMPFYAGWGLTHDRLKCERRKRRLTLEALFAGAYLHYAYYFDPDKPEREVEIEEAIARVVAYRQYEEKLYGL